MKNLWLKTGTVAVLALCSTVGAALADTTTSTSSTVPASAIPKSTAETTMAPSKLSRLLPDVISDWVVVTGPGLKDPTSMGTPDDAIDANQALNMEHFIGFKYKLSDSVALVPTMDIIYNFTDPNKGGADRGFAWGDAALSLRKSDLVSTSVGAGKFSADGFLNYYAPTSKVMRDNHAAGSVAVWFNPTLQLGKSKWSLSTYTFGRYYFETHDQDVNTGNATIRSKLYAGPQINYAFNDTVTAYFLYEGVMRTYTDGRPDWIRNGARSLSDVEPGAMINISKSIMLMPYLNWFLNQSIDTVSFNFNASIRLL